jgi:hypothetical protein
MNPLQPVGRLPRRKRSASRRRNRGDSLLRRIIAWRARRALRRPRYRLGGESGYPPVLGPGFLAVLRVGRRPRRTGAATLTDYLLRALLAAAALLLLWFAIVSLRALEMFR